MEKDEVREKVWNELEREGEARFPYPPHGRIPNFDGAEEAAELLRGTEEWRRAEVVKANPDAPQLPVRRNALEDGKVVYMAVPRLRGEKPFVELDPDVLYEEEYDSATTVSGYDSHGRRVEPEEMQRVDLVVSGCVAVGLDGGRVGKGEGFSDLEWAVLREAGLVDEDTSTATTVHPIQVEDERPEVEGHDVPMEIVVTPREVRRTSPEGKPEGLRRELLDAEDDEDITFLRRFL